MNISTMLAFRAPTKSTKAASSQPKKSATYSKKKGKMQESIAPSNLSEKKSEDDSDGDYKPSTTAKDQAKHTAKSKGIKSSEVEADAVPVPAPDTGLSSLKLASGSIHTGVLPVIPTQTPTTLAAYAHSYGSGFSTLPPLTSWATSSIMSATVVPIGTAQVEGTSRALGKSGNNERNSSNHLSVVVIVLVSISVAFLLLGGLIFYWRVHNRPRKRSCPTPSRPIFQDPFADQEMKGDEESLFGGKERSSAVARPNSNGLYPWVQYNPNASDPSGIFGTKNASIDSQQNVPTMPASVVVSEKPPQSSAPVRVPLPLVNTSAAAANPSLQQMQTALTRAANRISTLSTSMYPASPQSAHTNTGIGLAIGGTSPLTADGTSVLQRKPSRERMSKSRKSLRHSLAATEYLDIYDGAHISSPDPNTPFGSAPIPSTQIKSAMRKSTSIHTNANAQGRARVKAGYVPGGPTLRASSTVAGITTLRRAGDRTSMVGQSEADMQHMLPPLSPALKSESRRERDTRALASALGLMSPVPYEGSVSASPVPTLTPDDSITLAGDRVRTRTRSGGASHSRAHSEAAMSPGTEASARLGNLMLAEFTSMVSLPSSRTVGGVQASGSRARVVPRKSVGGYAGGGSSTSTRSDDRPPRVPSPPPLPSLAQMAMAHGNPEGYDDYRSPTYSIYGLYEAERKSRMQGGDGGF
ncbi:hypothetical protein C8Q80DRAFT_1270560 [Daedaleopsis nitida]|nr:hypothetical protein C8Q80DRAFT_1270560 [Daedaleopsis nitida]